MPFWGVIWLAILSLYLIAHTIKDSIEFGKIKKIEEEVDKLRGKS